MTGTDKIMFEIFRDANEPRAYHVVYYTELDENERDRNIDNAFAGDHVFDGYFAARDAARSKEAVAQLLKRLNAGEALDQRQLEATLAPHLIS